MYITLYQWIAYSFHLKKGPTERQILDNIEVIMEKGIPTEKIADYFKNTEKAAYQVLLDRYSFCEFMKNEVYLLHIIYSTSIE